MLNATVSRLLVNFNMGHRLLLLIIDSLLGLAINSLNNKKARLQNGRIRFYSCPAKIRL